MKSTLFNKIAIIGHKIANFQFSIFNFAKRNRVASLFENLRIDNYLKIGNWKLKIRNILDIKVVPNEVVSDKLMISPKVF